MSQRCDVVITGIGAVTSIAVGTDAFWDRLCSGASGIGVLPWADGHRGGEAIGGAVDDFEPKAHVRPRKALKVMCRELQTAFAAAAMAVQQAGLEDAVQQERVDRHRYGTVFGSEMLYGPPPELVDTYRRCLHDGSASASEFSQAALRELNPLWMLKYLPNMAACHVGIAVEAYGPNNTMVLGDTSGPAALIEAAMTIQRGSADAMITGATGTRISETRLLYRGDLPLARQRHPLSASSRPFAQDADGYVGAEGAAALMLESAALAARRGARPLARLCGSAVRFIPAPNGRRGSAAAISAAIEGALRDAGCSTSDVGLVVSHAMGDRQQDLAEQHALLQSLPGAAVTAPMGALGHAGAAAGTVNLITAVLVLDRGLMPPTLNADAVPHDFPLDLVAQPRPLTGQCVLTITHTTQGHATAVVLGRPSS